MPLYSGMAISWRALRRPVIGPAGQPGIRVYSPEGKLLNTMLLEIKPAAICVAADGSIFVAGDGRVLERSSAVRRRWWAAGRAQSIGLNSPLSSQQFSRIFVAVGISTVSTDSRYDSEYARE